MNKIILEVNYVDLFAPSRDRISWITITVIDAYELHIYNLCYLSFNLKYNLMYLR
jgi:hypothetical protein